MFCRCAQLFMVDIVKKCKNCCFFAESFNEIGVIQKGKEISTSTAIIP